eukprot:scaffold115_cov172-Amphora_coffeaeformis.AAC.11
MVAHLDEKVEQPTVPEAQGKPNEDGWLFRQSAFTGAKEARDASSQAEDGGWFDYFFGTIPPTEEKNERDASEDSREPAEAMTSRSQPPPASDSITASATDMINGFISWLDPAPHVAFSTPLPSNPPKQEISSLEKQNRDVSQNVTEEKVETKGERSASEKPKPETPKSPSKMAPKTDDPPKPTQVEELKSSDETEPLSGVAFAVSEDDQCTNDHSSLTSKASSTATSHQGKMFGDLDSIPSVNGGGSIANESIKTTDLGNTGGMSTVGKNGASVVEEKAKQVKMPEKKTGSRPEKLSPKYASIKTDTRRQLLLKELQNTTSTFGQYDIRAASIHSALGDLFDESKNHDQAIKMHRQAVDIYVSKLGDDHTSTLDARLNLGRVLENARKFDEAISLYYHVTMMRRAIRGEKDPSSADSLTRMAAALKKKEEYQLAIKELKRALKIYREALGDAHEKVSITVDEIASLYVTLGDFEKASAILEEVVKLKAATKGMKSKPVATTLMILATTYECSEQFAKAMKSLKKAYKIYTDMDGHSSLEATNTLNRIAQLYEAMGDNDRASIAYLGVLRGRKMSFGEDHLKVAETYFKLGHTLRQSGQQEKALKCMKEALPIYVSKGVEVVDVEMIAEVMHEMALINKEKHRYAESARILKQELGVRRKIGQAEFPMIARTLNHLGVAEYEMKNNNKSLKYFIEALTIYKDHAERSVECAEVLFNTGLCFESSRNKERAFDAYNEAARIFREHGYKDSHPHLAKAARKIARLQGGEEVTNK